MKSFAYDVSVSFSGKNKQTGNEKLSGRELSMAFSSSWFLIRGLFISGRKNE